MNYQQTQRLRELLIDACDRHVADGGKIIRLDFRNLEGKGCCPLYCLTRLPNVGKAMVAQVALLISYPGLSEQQLNLFTHVFDSGDKTFWYYRNNFPAIKLLALELRQRYLKLGA